MQEELIVLSVQKKKICFQRSWKFPRRGKGGDTEDFLVEGRKGLPCQVKEFVLDVLFLSQRVTWQERGVGLVSWEYAQAYFSTWVLSFQILPPLVFYPPCLLLKSIIELNSSAELMRLLWAVSEFPVGLMLHPWYLPLFLESGHFVGSSSIWVGSALFPGSVFNYYLSQLHIYSSLLSKMFRTLRNKLISDSVISVWSGLYNA